MIVVGSLRTEARGLDQMPTTVARFRSGGDAVTADLLEVILEVRLCSFPLAHHQAWFGGRERCLTARCSNTGRDHTRHCRHEVVHVPVPALGPTPGMC